jgi:hypothetical protein
MTVLAERAASPTRAETLRTLAGLEARRYARHPLFLLGAALLVVSMITGWKDVSPAGATGTDNLAPAFFLGLLGVFVGHRVTRSTARSAEAIQASPADGVTRTAALCLACLVPGAVALAWVAWMFSAIVLLPIPDSPAVTWAERAAIVVAGVGYAVGGPLVGVMVGRWTRFPGAGLVAAIVLVGWPVLVSLFSGAMSASRISNLVQLNAPFTLWMPSQDDWVAGGSPLWYLAYVTVLCGLAATAAMLHEASAAQRARFVRALLVLAVLAIGCLSLAALADPTRIPL